MRKQPVVIAGQTLGRFASSKLLFKESFRFLLADKEMMLIPLVATLLNLVIFGVVVAMFVILLSLAGFIGGTEQQLSPIIQYGFIFVSYVVGAFTFALSQAAITHTVYVRIQGGNTTLRESLRIAFSFWRPLLLWSLITSTVGLVLRMIIERSKILGSLVALVIGVAWSVLTYFVVPAMIIDTLPTLKAIRTSKTVFTKTWGETLVTNVSLGLVFLVAHFVVGLCVFGLIIVSFVVSAPVFLFPIIGLYFIWLIVAGLVNATLNGVVKTLLYVYASENIVPTNFNQELLENMLVRTVPASAQTPTAATIQTSDTNLDTHHI